MVKLIKCQGNEKLNDLMKTYWFRSNNKNGKDLIQFMENRNRIEFNNFDSDRV